MAVAVESFDFIPVRRAEVFEMFMFEGMVHVIAPVIGLVVAVPVAVPVAIPVAIPMIVAQVRQVVDAPALPAILLGRCGR